MTSIDALTSNSAAAAATPATSLYATPATQQPTQQMDGDMFLQLLVTQLKNQDPSSPMDTDQMITQTTQLSMMEQLTSMNSTDTQNFSLQMRTSAAALIGETVSYQDADGNDKSGTVTSVGFANSIPTVTVGSDTVSLDYLTGVAAASAPAAGAPAPTDPAAPSDPAEDPATQTPA